MNTTHEDTAAGSSATPREDDAARRHCPCRPPAAADAGLRTVHGLIVQLEAWFLRGVPDVLGRHHEDNVLGDVGGVVADPLQMAGNQNQLERGGDLAGTSSM